MAGIKKGYFDTLLKITPKSIRKYLFGFAF